MSTAFERVTVNLTKRSSEALSEVVNLTQDGKTGAINRALLMYSYFLDIQARGGTVYVRESPGAELERLRVL